MAIIMVVAAPLQVLVLPPFQRTGHASVILDALMGLARQGNYVDVTVEDPTEDLQRLRDRVDLKALDAAAEPAQLFRGAVEKALHDDVNAGRSGKHVPPALPKEVADTLRRTLKFCKPQIRRSVWRRETESRSRAKAPSPRAGVCFPRTGYGR